MSVMVALLVLWGGVAALAFSSSDHVMMSGHANAGCVSICLSNLMPSQVLPILQGPIQLLVLAVSFIVTVLAPLVILSVVAASYAARPRPSPNRIALYSNYLE